MLRNSKSNMAFKRNCRKSAASSGRRSLFHSLSFMSQPPALLDRVGYGGVMLFFGAALGACAGMAGLVVSQPPHFNVAALVVTLAVFFAIGFAFLERGADFVAVCAVSLLLVFSVAAEAPLHEPTRGDFSPRWCLLALVGWLAAIVYVLLLY